MKRRAISIGAVALVVLFGIVAFESVFRRAENYSYYPDYSSLNNEETGLKAYYETLVRLGVGAQRNYRPFLKLEGQKATIIYAGPNLGDFRGRSQKDLEQFERVARGGARVLLLFQARESRREKITPSTPGDVLPEKRPSKSPDETLPGGAMRRRWGIEVTEIEIAGKKRVPDPSVSASKVVRRDVRWHFAKWDPEWKPSVFDPEGNPSLLERSFGQGSVGLIASVQPFTNYQLLTDPNASLLAVTMAGPHPVIVDEAHLGVVENETITGLARQHHLDWILLGFVALAALYVWRNAVSFMPPLTSAEDRAVEGRDAHSALSGLLAQSVARDQLQNTIAVEWKHSERYVPNAGQLRKDELELFAAASVDEAAEAYLSLARKRNAGPDGAEFIAGQTDRNARAKGETRLVP